MFCDIADIQLHKKDPEQADMELFDILTAKQVLPESTILDTAMESSY